MTGLRDFYAKPRPSRRRALAIRLVQAFAKQEARKSEDCSVPLTW